MKLITIISVLVITLLVASCGQNASGLPIVEHVVIAEPPVVEPPVVEPPVVEPPVVEPPVVEPPVVEIDNMNIDTWKDYVVEARLILNLPKTLDVMDSDLLNYFPLSGFDRTPVTEYGPIGPITRKLKESQTRGCHFVEVDNMISHGLSMYDEFHVMTDCFFALGGYITGTFEYDATTNGNYIKFGPDEIKDTTYKLSGRRFEVDLESYRSKDGFTESQVDSYDNEMIVILGTRAEFPSFCAHDIEMYHTSSREGKYKNMSYDDTFTTCSGVTVSRFGEFKKIAGNFDHDEDTVITVIQDGDEYIRIIGGNNVVTIDIDGEESFNAVIQ